ncbi:mitochondrial 28S ribosomal protein s27 domain-containing protein [Phthorimaea operculella]|nr:mitochondrial 28S ribosomal protein s27 domain-containing protein [Phthorimaea operculella]
MLRSFRRIPVRNSYLSIYIQKQTFLTNDYKCTDAWNAQTSSPILTKVNLNDFYNILDQNFSSKGVISAIDVDIFANAVKDSVYLEELKDLLHKLRKSAETGNTLESTHHATIRNFIEFGHVEELLDILKDPLNFGVFLDDYAANILLDKLITDGDYEKAACVASLVVLQEEYTNEITCALCQYACYKFITNYSPPAAEPAPEEKKKKVEELKIQIIDLMKKESESVEGETKEVLEKCVSLLSKVDTADTALEESLKVTIENAINKVQTNDIKQQQQLFKSWAQIREEKLEEQTKRLDRAKRMQLIQERQDQMKQEEQRLWFFENEEAIDLQIEEKEKLVEAPTGKKATAKTDEEYIPPEILPKRK